MADWKPDGAAWEKRTEQLASDVWMTCFRRPNYKGNWEDRMWVYLSDRPIHLSGRMIIDRILIEPSDHLLQECVAHEMRKKYGAGDGGVSPYRNAVVVAT